VSFIPFDCSNPGDINKAAEDIKKAIEWRKEHAELLALVKSGEPLPYVSTIKKFSVSEPYSDTKDGGPITIVRAGLSNPQAIMDELSHEQVLDWFMYEKVNRNP